MAIDTSGDLTSIDRAVAETFNRGVDLLRHGKKSAILSDMREQTKLLNDLEQRTSRNLWKIAQLLRPHLTSPDDDDILLIRARMDSAENAKLANIDALTQLSNKAGMESFFKRTVKDLQDKKLGEGSDLAMIFFDLDRFKNVNDLFGHVVGDQILKIVGDGLRVVSRQPQEGAMPRQADLAARLGGDEFVVMFVSRDGEDVKKTKAAIVARLNEYIAKALVEQHGLSGAWEPIIVNGLPSWISSGVAKLSQCKDQNPAHIEELLSLSDHEMYKDKQARRRESIFRVNT